MSPITLPLPACNDTLRQLALPRHKNASSKNESFPPPLLSATDGILSDSVRLYWWPLFSALGFDYHHFWSGVCHVRALTRGSPSAGTIEADSPRESLLILFTLLLHAESQGHVCLPASLVLQEWTSHLHKQFQEQNQFPRESLSLESLSREVALPAAILEYPSLPGHSPCSFLCIRGAGGNHHFYTLRSLRLEEHVVTRLSELAGAQSTNSSPGPIPAELLKGLDQGQAGALEQSRGRSFFILSGGPGTGKTTLAKRMVALFALDFLHHKGRFPLVRICAPTGRAASRLGQAFLECGFTESRELKALLGTAAASASTVHRLIQELSWTGDPQSCGPDLVLIDETSMVDLSLMDRLLAALPDKTALHILGDHCQLPSVDSGALLGDLLQSSLDFGLGTGSPWAAVLSHCHRSDTSIQDAAKAVQNGTNLLLSPKAPPTWSSRTCGTSGVFTCPATDWLQVYLEELAFMAGVSNPRDLPHFFSHADTNKLVQVLTSLVVLSPLRKGPFGTMAANADCRQRLELGPEALLPVGLPVMVTKNDPTHGVWNGDRGVISLDSRGQRILQATAQSKHADCPFMSGIKEWESSFVMTCHKSQGSEFDTVILLVPEQGGEVLSRELLYTGMTRAKRRLIIAADSAAWQASLGIHTLRHSRIRESLLERLAAAQPLHPS